MRKLKKLIIKIVDFFYFPIIRKFMPLQTFRYGVCGGINLLLDAIIYALIYNFILHGENLELGIVTISPQIAAFIITFPIIFLTGFWLAKYISFEGRKGDTASQRGRYLMVVVLNILVKYSGLKFLTISFSVKASIANVLMTIITVIVSYLLQNYFTFKKTK